MKRLAILFALNAAAIVFVAVLIGPGLASTGAAAVPAQAVSHHARIVIHHQVRGCHNWSVDGASWHIAQHVSLAAPSTITFQNRDMMPHRLVQESGPAVTYVGHPNMAYMTASVTVRFPRAGTYRFTTKPGRVYMKMKTIGSLNVLRLTVTVS